MKSEVEIREELAHWYGLAEELRIRLPEVPHLEWRGEDKDIATFVFNAHELNEFSHLVYCQTMAQALNWVLADEKKSYK